MKILTVHFIFIPTAFAQFGASVPGLEPPSNLSIGNPAGTDLSQQRVQDSRSSDLGALGGASTSSPSIAPRSGEDQNRGTLNPGTVTLPPPPSVPVPPIAPPAPPFPIP